ncbi:MAG TPA: FxLYD domain-containing protein [Thermoanaerobaculia bacterium]|nr:FxLYD domain-containing protein [Thermoanaerobaculia bacterium]
MNVIRSRPFLSFLLAAGAALGALPGRCGADWLLTRDGGRIETRGPFEVKGKLVVFTTKEGSLSSLRLAQVDVEASRRATAEAQLVSEEDLTKQPARRKKSVRSITDKDFAHPVPAADAAPAKPEDAAKPEEAKAKSVPAGTVSVGIWQKIERAEKDGIEIAGILKNDGDDIATDVGLAVTLYDDGGGVLATAAAVLAKNVIAPHGDVDFRASFPGVFTLARAKFDIKSVGLKVHIVDDKPGGKPPG